MTNPPSTNAEKSALTDAAYWEGYYGQHRVVEIQRSTIESMGAHFEEFWSKIESLRRDPVSSVCEIGCYPGRFLAHAAARFGATAIGLDFNSDRQAILDSFECMGVKEHEIINADFMSYQPIKTADLVFSIGFVEHFYNYEEVLDRHLEFLSPHGFLLLSIPNMRGLIQPYKRLVDQENLRIHNLESMRLSVFEKFAERNKLKTHFLGFRGGFPANVHDPISRIRKFLIYYPAKYLSIKLKRQLSRHPSSWYSGEIVGLFSRND